MPRAELLDLGRLTSRTLLLRRGRIALQGLDRHGEALAASGWTPDRTHALRDAWRELADTLDEELDAAPGPGALSFEAATAIAETQSLVQQLQEALRNLFLFDPPPGLTLQDFSFSGFPLQTADGLVRYLEHLRPLVERLSGRPLPAPSVVSTARLDDALQRLRSAGSADARSPEDAPAESMRLLELKGALLEHLMTLEAAAVAAYGDGDPRGAEFSLAGVLPPRLPPSPGASDALVPPRTLV